MLIAPLRLTTKWEINENGHQIQKQSLSPDNFIKLASDRPVEFERVEPEDMRAPVFWCSPLAHPAHPGKQLLCAQVSM